MRKNFEDQIKVLQRQNDSGIESFLGSFKGNLKLVQAEYEDSKKTADSLKQIYEEKLTQQEDEHEAEIMDEKRKFNELSEELNDKIGVLNNKIGTEDRQIKRLVEEGKQFQAKEVRCKKKKETLKKQLEERKYEVAKLEAEKEEIQI